MSSQVYESKGVEPEKWGLATVGERYCSIECLRMDDARAQLRLEGEIRAAWLIAGCRSRPRHHQSLV